MPFDRRPGQKPRVGCLGLVVRHPLFVQFEQFKNLLIGDNASSNENLQIRTIERNKLLISSIFCKWW